MCPTSFVPSFSITHSEGRVRLRIGSLLPKSLIRSLEYSVRFAGADPVDHAGLKAATSVNNVRRACPVMERVRGQL